MHSNLYKIFFVIIVAGMLTTSCEWTASEGESTWSQKYDNMNFSGTYTVDITGGVPGTDDVTTGYTEVVRNVVVVDSFTDVSSVTGTLRPNIIPGSVTISVHDGSGGSISWTDIEQEGELRTSSTLHPTPGSITYSTGNFVLRFNRNLSGQVRATYTYGYDITVIGDDEQMFRLTHVTVDQNGNNLQMIFSNGLTMKGKFTRVNDVPGMSVPDMRGFNAGFKVENGKHNFIGTLDSTDIYARRNIDGTLKYEGKFYRVKGDSTGAPYNTRVTSPSPSNQSGQNNLGNVP